MTESIDRINPKNTVGKLYETDQSLDILAINQSREAPRGLTILHRRDITPQVSPVSTRSKHTKRPGRVCLRVLFPQRALLGSIPPRAQELLLPGHFNEQIKSVRCNSEKKMVFFQLATVSQVT